MTTERKAGWFWVRRDDIGWVVARHEPGRTRAADEMGDEPAPWVFAGLSFPDETWEEIGDRIPAPDDLERLRETARLAERFVRVKGRHHSQHAMCDLLEHFGLPCVRRGDQGGRTVAGGVGRGGAR